jgi:hypothetical protein
VDVSGDIFDHPAKGFVIDEVMSYVTKHAFEKSAL